MTKKEASMLGIAVSRANREALTRVAKEAQDRVEPVTIEELFMLDPQSRKPCPNCGRRGHWSRIKKRKAMVCLCGYHYNPLARTIFRKSRTPLHKWYQAMTMLEATSNQVSATELSRLLQITYKTAWRMKHLLTAHDTIKP